MSAADMVRRTADALARAPEVMARAGAEVLVEELTRSVARDTHGDRRLRNLDAVAGAPRITVRDDSAEVTAGGPVWAILESGTRAHTIKSASGRTRVGQEWRSGPVRVRGVRGKRTYSQTVTRSVDRVFDAQRVEWERAHG